MKKQLLIILGLTFFVGNLSAQLTLDHTFSGLLTQDFPGLIIEPMEYYYYNNNVDGKGTVYLYNSNYSLYKTVVWDSPSGYLSLFVVSPLGRHLINTDEKIEFLVHYSYDSIYPIRSHMMIINEDGNLIQELGQSSSMGYSGIYKVGNQLRLNIIKIDDNQNGQTDVYICHGNYSAVSSFEHNNIMMQPFPNPTTTLINLPYHIDKGTVSTINIYNINGQFIESYNIGGDFERITIDVKKYNKGIYVYEYNGISNRFLVQ